MRHKLRSNTAFCVLAAALAGPVFAQATKTGADVPCKQVESACKSAGFVGGGSSKGIGLWDQCMDPLLQGHPTKSQLPLPKIDEKVITACREEWKAKKPGAGDSCKQVESACKSAGFVGGGSTKGIGLWDQCMDPLLQGHPTKSQLPLPKIDEKVITACREEWKAKKPKPKE